MDRKDLLSNLEKSRKQFFEKKPEQDENRYTVPISEMGNYHEILLKRETLREIDDEKAPGPILFGNPFRREKVHFPNLLDKCKFRFFFWIVFTSKSSNSICSGG